METNITAKTEPTLEQLQHENMMLREDNEDLHKQVELFVSQLAEADDRICDWRSKHEDLRKKHNAYCADAKRSADSMLLRIQELEAAAEKRKVAKHQERAARVATASKLVVIAASLLIPTVAVNLIQKFGLIDAQIGFALQAICMMGISWCYALIWDRTRK